VICTVKNLRDVQDAARRLRDPVRLGLLDAIRVAPKVTRALEGGPDPIAYLDCGRHHDGDGAIQPTSTRRST
jgi:hypothetical protein